MQSFNFDLTPVAVSVVIAGETYTLREASEAAAIQWRNANLGAAKLKDGKPISFSGMADSAPLLVSLCLRKQEDGGIGAPVPLETIRQWPARVVKPLYEWIKDNSDLRERDDQKALEKRWVETSRALIALSESGRDRRAWQNWMTEHILHGFEDVENIGPEPEKNS